jgi:hypothetical protein
MQKFIGVICLVSGVLLVVWGHNVSQAIGSQLHRAITGSAPDKAVFLYAGGAVLGLLGLFQIFWGQK